MNNLKNLIEKEYKNICKKCALSQRQCDILYLWNKGYTIDDMCYFEQKDCDKKINTLPTSKSTINRELKRIREKLLKI